MSIHQDTLSPEMKEELSTIADLSSDVLANLLQTYESVAIAIQKLIRKEIAK